VRECGEQRAVSWREPHLGVAELALQYCDLVSQGQDLGVFVPVASGEQTE
jgi:hypothetical protein